MTMVAERSDAEIIAASVRDPAEFGVVFERHERAVLAYLRSRVGADAAVDLAARVFADAFVARERFRPVHTTALPWLFGFAANHLRRHHRTEHRRRRFLGSLATAVPHLDPADDAVARADAARAWEVVGPAVDALPGPVRETLLLHLWAELTYEEIAEALGVPIGTVRSRINRAKGRLREALEVAGFDPGTDEDDTAGDRS